VERILKKVKAITELQQEIKEMKIETPEEQCARGNQFYDRGDYVQARAYYEKAAARGNAVAQNNLGELYFTGKGVSQDYYRAKEWYKLAAAQGQVDAQIGLVNAKAAIARQVSEGQNYAHSIQQTYVPVKTSKATSFQEQPEYESPSILYYRGCDFFNSGNYIQAKECYEKAVAQGHLDSLCRLSGMYLNGLGCAKDLHQFKKCITECAAKGHAAAQYSLSMLYKAGKDGFPQDSTKANEWLLKAADQGYSRAKCELAEEKEAAKEELWQKELAAMEERTLQRREAREAREERRRQEKNERCTIPTGGYYPPVYYPPEYPQTQTSSSDRGNLGDTLANLANGLANDINAINNLASTFQGINISKY
jgi:TPR repeat protein